MAENIDDVFRDWNVLGDPASGEYEPEKPRIRALLWQIQASSGQSVTRNTLAQLNAVTPPTENYGGVVLNDPNPANNGYYARVSGAWVRGRGFPDTFAEGVLSGSGSAQVASFDTGINPADIEVFWSRVATENTGPMTLNGKPVLSVAGNPLVAGEWSGIVLYVDEGPNWRLLIDVNAAQIASQAASDALDAAVRAENAASSFTEVATNFRTVPALIADVTMGYAGSGADVIVATGDVVAAQGYRYEVAASGATDHDIETAGGVKFYAVLGTVVDLAQFNGDFRALLTAIEREDHGGATINIPKGSYAFTEGVRLPTTSSGNDWRFNGAVFDFAGADNDDLIPVYGNTPNAFFSALGTKEAIPDLASNVSKGGFVLTFAAAHGLAPGDVIEIYNPTDNSWSGARTYYRAGELARVMVVVDNTTVWIDSPLWDDYAAAGIEMSKYITWKGEIDGLHVIGNGSTARPTYGVVVDFASNVHLNIVSASNISYQAISIARCMDFKLEWCGGAEDGVLGSFGGSYGLGIYSSQRGEVENSHFLAGHHGITHGNVDGSVPYRDIHYRYCSASGNRDPLGGNFGWDWHGIGEFCSAEYCVMPDGVTSGCKDITIANCKITNFPGQVICFWASTETVGGYCHLIDNTYHVSGSVSGSWPVLQMRGGGFSTAHINLSEDMNYVIRNGTFTGTEVGNSVLAAGGSVNDNHKVNYDIDGIDDSNSTTRTRILTLSANNETITPASFVRVKNIKRARKGGVCYLARYEDAYPAPEKCSYDSQSGAVTFASGTGAAATSAVTFPYLYPEVPSWASADCNEPSTVNSGNNYPIARAQSVTASGLSLAVRTNAFNSFTSSVGLTVRWQADLSR